MGSKDMPTSAIRPVGVGTSSSRGTARTGDMKKRSHDRLVRIELSIS